MPPQPDHVRLCLAVVKGLLRDNDSVDRFTRQRRIGDGQGVRIERAPADRRPHAIECRFKPDAQAGPRSLASVSIDGQKLGTIRLHLMQRFWLTASFAAFEVAHPVRGAEHAPIVGRTLARILQAGVNAAPSLALYGLLAAAYSLVFGLVGRINLAFGEATLAGGIGLCLGFAVLPATAPLGIALGLGVLTALAASAALGVLSHHALAQPFLGMRGQAAMVASIGFTIASAEAIRLLQGSRPLWLAPVMHSPFALARAGDFIVTATPSLVVVSLVALTASVLLVAGMRRSRFGRAWRAVSDDPMAARLIGIDSRRVLMRTFTLAAILSGLAGLLATLHYGAAPTTEGLALALKALVAAVVGGIGSIGGALLGGMLIALVEALWASFRPIEHGDIVVLLLLVVFLVLRPGGLLGRELPERSERDQ